MGTNDAAEMLAAAQAEVVRLEHQVTQLEGQLEGQMAVNSWPSAAAAVTPPADPIVRASAEARILELLSIDRGLMVGIADPDGLILQPTTNAALVNITLIGIISRGIADQIIAEAGRIS